MERKTSMSTQTQTTKKIPLCAYGSYDCKNCVHPQVAKTIRENDLGPCEGEIYFCRFATEYNIMAACKQFNLQNYHCTHGGGTCPGYPVLRDRLFYGKEKVQKQKVQRVLPVGEAGANEAVDKHEQAIEAIKNVGGCGLF
jgi:hypothetical protein